MDEKRIEELIEQAWRQKLDNRRQWRYAIITAINETKDEDAEICNNTFDKHLNGNNPWTLGAADYRRAILASKVKPLSPKEDATK